MIMHANEHRGYFPLSGLIFNGVNNPATPNGLGDGSMQRYDYFSNATSNSLVLGALPCALATYLGLPSGSTGGQGYKWQDAYANMLPLREYFTCPANQELINAKWDPEDAVMNADGGDPTIHNPYGNGARWWYCVKNGNYTNGYSSYGFNDEILGWNDNGSNSVTGYNRARGNQAIIPHPSDTMLMADGNVNTWTAEPGGGGTSLAFWVTGSGNHLGDVYNGKDTAGNLTAGKSGGTAVFDLLRHHGNVNILYVDGHVDSQPILDNGATVASGTQGQPGNMGSGGLMGVSVNVDFR
jgi:prepilin-type processing-associated H-X9-DG protein